jgi:hypothetical protein
VTNFFSLSSVFTSCFFVRLLKHFFVFGGNESIIKSTKSEALKDTRRKKKWMQQKNEEKNN